MARILEADVLLIVLQHRRSSNHTRTVSARTAEGGHAISFLTSPRFHPICHNYHLQAPSHPHTNHFLSSHVVPSLASL